MGVLSDFVIEIFSMESALLRSQKILNGADPRKGVQPLAMTKLICHDGIATSEFVARQVLEASESGVALRKHLSIIRNLLISPPFDVISLRRSVADAMLRCGRYYF